MLVLVTYDVSVDPKSGGPRRLRKIAKTCLNYGVRVQNSVFECEVNPAQFEFLKSELLEIYDESKDSLRFYRLGKFGHNRVEHFGANQVAEVTKDVLIL